MNREQVLLPVVDNRLESLRKYVKDLGERIEGLQESRDYAQTVLSQLEAYRALLVAPEWERYFNGVSAYVAAITGEGQDEFNGHAQVELPLGDGRFAGTSVTKSTQRLLQENGNEPMHVKVIWDRLKQGGIQLKSRNPLAAINTMLLRSREFENIGRRTWRLKGETFAQLKG